MHRNVLRALAAQHFRNLRVEAADQRRSRGAGPLKVQAPTSRGRHRVFALRRAADPCPVRSSFPAVATAPDPHRQASRPRRQLSSRSDITGWKGMHHDHID